MYSEEIRDNVLREFINDDSLEMISKSHNISMTTLYRWIKRAGFKSGRKNCFREIFKLMRMQEYSKVLDFPTDSYFIKADLWEFIKNEIAKENIEYETLYCNRMESLFTQGKNDEIILEYNKKSFPSSVSFQLIVIKTFERLGQYRKALDICNQEIFSLNETIQHQKISILVKLGRFDEALSICNREEFKYSDIIQSQKISIIITRGQLKEALSICNREDFYYSKDIQKKNIGILIKQGRFDEALSICNREEFKYSDIIQSRNISILVKQGRFDEALSICNREDFYYSIDIQNQKLEILIKQEKFTEALTICNRAEFKYSDIIQNKKISILVKQRQLKEALSICNRVDFFCCSNIQSQKISILVKQGQLKEALCICNREEFKYSDIIQSQKIGILIKLGQFEEALCICNQENFYYSASIQSRKIDILIQLGQFEEALAICYRKEFSYNKYIQKKKTNLKLRKSNHSFRNNDQILNHDKGECCYPISREESELNHAASFALDAPQKYEEHLRMIFTKIYADVATVEMIEDSFLSEFEITVLMLMYYEKNIKAKAICFIKEKMANNNFSQEQIKMLKVILENLKLKRSLFDYGIYGKILNVGVDLDLYNEILKTGEKEKLSVEVLNNKDANERMIIKGAKEENANPIEKKNSIASKQLESNHSSNAPLPKVKVKQKKDKKPLKKEKKETIKEKFATEYNEILRYLYIKVFSEEDQIRSLKAFDRFLLLGERAYDDIYRVDSKTGETIKCGEVFDRIIDACYSTNGNKRVRKNWK